MNCCFPFKTPLASYGLLPRVQAATPSRDREGVASQEAHVSLGIMNLMLVFAMLVPPLKAIMHALCLEHSAREGNASSDASNVWVCALCPVPVRALWTTTWCLTHRTSRSQSKLHSMGWKRAPISSAIFLMVFPATIWSIWCSIIFLIEILYCNSRSLSLLVVKWVVNREQLAVFGERGVCLRSEHLRRILKY